MSLSGRNQSVTNERLKDLTPQTHLARLLVAAVTCVPQPQRVIRSAEHHY